MREAKQPTPPQQPAAQLSRPELIRQLRLAQEHLSDLAWELEELELRLQPLQDQLQELGSADLLVAREVEQLRQRRSLQEELVLRQMLLIDELKQRIAELEQPGEQRASGAAL